jgi:SAM-dependent methyltransferase
MIKKALQVFLAPGSPAAVYRHPGRLLNYLRATAMNCGLRLEIRLKPGNGVACNICGWQGRKFGYSAAVSVDYFAPNDLCLACRSNLRTRALIGLLVQNTDMHADMVVADVGASPATRKFFDRYPNVRYLVVDRYKEADICCDITAIRLPSDSVDRVLCCHVLEHIEAYRQGVSELFRILRRGHCGIIAVPQTPGLALSQRTQARTFQGYGHVWEFGDDFAQSLKDAGFRVTTTFIRPARPADEAQAMPYHVVFKD